MKQNWEIKKLKDICEKGSSNVNMKDLTDLQGEYPIYGASGLIKNVNFYHQDKEYIGIIKDGSGIGRTMLLPPKSSVIGTLQYILPKGDNLIQFINYALQSLDLTKFKQGAAIPHIYFKDYGETEIVVPPLADQRRIVAILDTKFAKIDALRAAAQKNLDNAEQLWKAQLEKEFGNKEWKIKKLIEICTNIVDCPHTTPQKSPTPTEYPCIRTSELKNGQIDWSSMQYLDKEEYLKRIARLEPKENDIVYGREGTFGDAVLLPNTHHFSLGQRTMLLRPNAGIVIPKFLLLMIISPFVYNQALEKNTGCGVPHVNVADVKNFSIPIPPLAEQTAIVSHLDALSAQISELKAKYRRQIDCCDELRQSLLREAFEGEM